MTLRFTIAGPHGHHVRARYKVTAEGQELVGHADLEREAIEGAVELARAVALASDNGGSYGEAVVWDESHRDHQVPVWTVEVTRHGR